MANIQPTIEQAAEAYGKALDKVKTELASLVDGMSSQGLTRGEMAARLFEVDFVELLGKEYGLDAATGQLALAHGLVVDKMTKFGKITPEMLEGLVNLDQATLIKRTELIATQAQKVVLQNVMQGTQGAVKLGDVIKSALDADISTAAVKTEVNTILNTFSRSVNNEMSATAPKGTKYVYEGPVDEKTRDICLEMAAAGELTRDEIASDYPGTFLDGGGFNCRHQWTETDAAFFTDQKKAEELSEGKPKAQTPLEKSLNPQIKKAPTKKAVDRAKVSGAFKEARKRKMNIDSGLNLVAKQAGVSQKALNEAYGAVARKGLTPSADGFIDSIIKELS